ncbi:hypothetical protein CLV92_10134 [Kineococcus xinjiangensis]|uniref:Uncharacterized protein n=1 Tax=Kineococcus xinjiangensis TaxID=512762 RepID=A0A2S6IVE9_9ACTN|nr:hypothetical protein CLV92_10134 [Kineococcus xinjiangensis]
MLGTVQPVLMSHAEVASGTVGGESMKQTATGALAAGLVLALVNYFLFDNTVAISALKGAGFAAFIVIIHAERPTWARRKQRR